MISLEERVQRKFMVGSPDGVEELNVERFLHVLEYKEPYILYLEEKSALDGSFPITETKDIYDFPFCIFVVTSFDRESFYIGSIFPVLTLPIK